MLNWENENMKKLSFWLDVIFVKVNIFSDKVWVHFVLGKNWKENEFMIEKILRRNEWKEILKFTFNKKNPWWFIELLKFYL
jgi:hypothetical protein